MGQQEERKAGHAFDNLSEGYKDSKAPAAAGRAIASPKANPSQRIRSSATATAEGGGRGRGLTRSVEAPVAVGKPLEKAGSVQQMSKRKMLAKTINLNNASSAFVTDLLAGANMDF